MARHTTSADNGSRQNGQNITRRRYLIGGALAVGSLAGCAGDGDGGQDETTTTTTTTTDDGGTDTTTTTSGGTPVDSALSGLSIHIPGDQNWQIFSPQFPNSTASVMLHHVGRNMFTGEKNWVIGKNFQYDPDSQVLTLELKEGFKWWNGDPVTAEDLFMRNEIFRLQAPDASPWEKHELVDDYTLKSTRKNPINTTILRNSIRTRVDTYRELYRPWLEEYQDATSQSARDEITTRASEEFSVSTQEFVDNGYGNGPYKIQDFSTTGYTLEKFEDHPWADDITVPEFEWVIATDQGPRQQHITNDNIDLGRGLFPSSLEGAAPDHLENLANVSGLTMAHTVMNQGGPNGEFFKQRGVRRAILALTHLPDVVQNSFPNSSAKEIQTGMDPNMDDTFLDDGFKDSLIQYPVERDYEQADAFLEETDLTRQNGTVVDQSGNAVEIEFLGQNTAFRKNAGETIAAHMEDYGFNVNFRALPWGQMQTVFRENMQFDLHVTTHNARGTAYPDSYFQPTHIFGLRLGKDMKNVKSWYDEGRDRSPFNGKPLFPEVPTEIGAMDLSGETEQFSHAGLWEELRQASSEERAKEIITKLAWYHNFDIPQFDITPRPAGMWGDTENFNWPEKNSQPYKTPKMYSMVVKQGLVDPVYE